MARKRSETRTAWLVVALAPLVLVGLVRRGSATREPTALPEPGPRLRYPTPTDDLLPVPPSDIERDSYLRSGNLTYALCAIGGIVASLVSLSHLAGLTPALNPFWILVIAVACSSGCSLYVQLRGTSRFDIDEHRARVGAWQPASHPTVDVFLPVCREPLDVLLNTWEWVRRMEYPGEVRVHVLDDGCDDDVRAAALERGLEYRRRDNPGWFKKAGNLQAAFTQTTGEFIVVLDADFCPRPEMLTELLPYFEDPTLGIVQSPQYFRIDERQPWIQRGAAAVQEFFYRAVQPSRNHLGGSICVGTNAIYRRRALEDNGGPTLIGHSEDVHTGFDLRRLGWRLTYVPINLASGLCPDRLAAFYKQQYRWCSGSMSLLRSRKFWTARMSLRERLCYASGFSYYVMTAMRVLTAPLTPILLFGFVPQVIHWRGWLMLLPAWVFLFLVVPAWHRAAHGVEVFSVRQVYAWAHLLSIVDSVRGRTRSWEPTGSVAARTSDDFPRFVRAFSIWTLLTGWLWVGLAAGRFPLIGWSALPLLGAGIFEFATAFRVVRLGAAELKLTN